MNGMKVFHAQGKSTMTVGKRFIEQAENGKEYLFSVGQHVAMLQSLEEQMMVNYSI